MRQPATKALLITLLIIPLAAAIGAPKVDVVYVENGDRFTGEFRSLQRGQVELKTDVAGTIYLEWERISQIIVKRAFLVETVEGTRYSGQIDKTDSPDEIAVITSDGVITIRNVEVAKLNPLDQGGWRDVRLSVSAGYNFAKASNVSQLNGSVSVSKQTRKYIASADASTNTSNSSDNSSSQRSNLSLAYSKLRPNRWVTSGILSADSNDELNINLRTSLGAGGGRILSQSDHTFFLLQGGLLLSREDIVGEAGSTDSVESFMQMQWDWFKFTKPNLDWSMTLTVIPSLTENGRVRSEADATLSWKIFGDLHWQIQLYNSYDNKPQTDDASSNDYGVNTSVAYKF
jgi:hypothetical protein